MLFQSITTPKDTFEKMCRNVVKAQVAQWISSERFSGYCKVVEEVFNDVRDRISGSSTDVENK